MAGRDVNTGGLANVQRLIDRMDALGVEGLVASTFENVLYFTGVQSLALQVFPYTGHCFAVVSRQAPTRYSFVSSNIEVDQLLDGFEGVDQVVTFGEFYRELPNDAILTEDEERLRKIALESPRSEDALGALVQTLEVLQMTSSTVGIDECGVHPDFLEALRIRLPRLRFVPFSDELRWVRRVKTAEEVRRLKHAAEIVEHAIGAAAKIARPGVTEREMARELNVSVTGLGGIPRFTLVRFGRGGVGGQVTPGGQQLLLGDTIWFDIGCTFGGYWADIGRTYVLGQPERDTGLLFASLLRAQQWACENVRAGFRGSDLFAMTMTRVKAAGFEGYRRHHLGHSIGLEAYERPLITPSEDQPIEQNSVVNIETPYYEFARGALIVEDPVLVGDLDSTKLTKLRRDLVDIRELQ